MFGNSRLLSAAIASSALGKPSELGSVPGRVSAGVVLDVSTHCLCAGRECVGAGPPLGCVAQYVAAHQGSVRYRKTRQRVVLVGRGRGWIAVSDGPSFAADLARYLDLRRLG